MAILIDSLLRFPQTLIVIPPMQLPKEILTKRLRLRPVAEEHANFIFEYATKTEVNQNVSWLAPSSIADTQAYVSQCQEDWQSGRGFSYIFCDIHNEELIGAIATFPSGHAAQIGYVTHPKYWRHGFASEAGIELSALVLADPQIYRLWTVCTIENAASARVLEKMGFKLEGILQQWSLRPNVNQRVPVDCFCYSKVK